MFYPLSTVHNFIIRQHIQYNSFYTFVFGILVHQSLSFPFMVCTSTLQLEYTPFDMIIYPITQLSCTKL